MHRTPWSRLHGHNRVRLRGLTTRPGQRRSWPKACRALFDAAPRLSAAEVCANKLLARPFKAFQCLLEDRFRSHVLRFGLEITQQPMA